MKKTSAAFVAVALSAACCVYADYSCWDTGAWPKRWPEELEPLRKQSRSIQGPVDEFSTHHVPFASREDFESAWPHLLAVKTNGAPIILVRSPSSHWHFGETEAGVLVHCPPAGTKDSAAPIGPNQL